MYTPIGASPFDFGAFQNSFTTPLPYGAPDTSRGALGAPSGTVALVVVVAPDVVVVGAAVVVGLSLADLSLELQPATASTATIARYFMIRMGGFSRRSPRPASPDLRY